MASERTACGLGKKHRDWLRRSVRAGQRLVLHHRIGDEEMVECLAADTGKSLWRFGYPSHFVDPYGYNNGPRCTPLLTSNLCYTFGAEGRLTCLELQTGKLVWQRDTAADFNVPEAFFGVGSTPHSGRGPAHRDGGWTTQFGPGGIRRRARGKTVWESVGQSNWEGAPMTGWPGEQRVQWKAWDKQASYSTPVAATLQGGGRFFA